MTLPGSFHAAGEVPLAPLAIAEAVVNTPEAGVSCRHDPPVEVAAIAV